MIKNMTGQKVAIVDLQRQHDIQSVYLEFNDTRYSPGMTGLEIHEARIKLQGENILLTNNLSLAQNWNVNPTASARAKADLVRILGSFGEAKMDLNRNDGIIIYKNLTYLMDVKEAFDKLGERVSSFTSLNTPYFANRSFKCFAISKIITDGDTIFNKLILVTDAINQLIAVQLVNENPKTGRSSMNDRDKDYSMYNIIQNRTKATPNASINYNVYFVGDKYSGGWQKYDNKSNVLCIESELVSRTTHYESKEFVRLYLPVPIVNLVLYCLQTQK